MALTMQWCWNQTGYFKDASETLTQTEKNKKYAKCQRRLYQYHQYSGCWYTYPSEKYEFVSWDDEIPN